jgi:hypothetical protein
MPTIILRAKHPRDVLRADLDSLAAELRAAIAGVDPELLVTVEPGDDDDRPGVTFVEVIYAVVEGVAGAGLTLTTQAVSSWLKRRSEEKSDRRPRLVSLLGPDGKVVREVRRRRPE